MNGKERFAGAVLLVTLAIGIVFEVFGRRSEEDGVSFQVSGRSVSSTTDGDDAFRRINLNAASVEELEILPGIGPKKAEAIVKYRDRNGPFNSLCRLTGVKGIGKKTVERITPYAFVSTEVSPAGD